MLYLYLANLDKKNLNTPYRSYSNKYSSLGL